MRWPVLERRFAAPPGEPSPTFFPPPPHDPRERDLAAMAGPWEVRVFGKGDRRRAYFPSRGLWHMQLWHPAGRISVLSPSRLTGGRYEVFPVLGWKLAAASVEDVRAVVWKRHRVVFPMAATLRALEEWFVDAVTRAAGEHGEPASP